MAQLPTQQPTKALALKLMERRLESRQRFDSADYAMGVQLNNSNASHELLPLHIPPPQNVAQGDHVERTQCEIEPEPEALSLVMKHFQQQSSATSIRQQHFDNSSDYPQQYLRRYRLQRFDSADWAMQTSTTQNDNGPVQYSVAKVMLDRHTYRTCPGSSTSPSQLRML